MTDFTANLRDLDQRIITIESLRYRGSFIDANDSMKAKHTGCPRSQIVDQTWCKFIVHHVEGNIVCFESLRYRDHYLDMNTEKTKAKTGDHHIVKITQCNYLPTDAAWAKFSIFGSTLGRVGIRSERWNDRWLDAHESGDILGSLNDPNTPPPADPYPWGLFSLQFAQPIKDEYELVAQHFNASDTPIDYKYQYTLGVSRTDSSSHTNSAELSLELQKNFGTAAFSSGSVKFGSKYSQEWSTSTANTYSAATSITTTLPIAAYEGVKIYQLIGTYGPLTVGSNFTRNETMDRES